MFVQRSSLVLALAVSATVASLTTGVRADGPWSFGVMSDTQWTVSSAESNPNTYPAALVDQLNQQFISQGVKLVVDVGDSVDSPGANDANIIARAQQSEQALYNAGIGYYTLRGNHEAESLTSGVTTAQYYPQIGYTLNYNASTGGTTGTAGIFAAGTNGSLTVGTNFTYPTAVNNANAALSYSFTYNGASFVLLDQFDKSGNTNDSTIAQQQSWINATLQNNSASTYQAFVFGHKNLLGGNHKDNLFGANVTSNDPGDGSGVNWESLTASQLTALQAKQAAETAFIDGLSANKVQYYTSGHDHHDYDSIVNAIDNSGSVHQIISVSDSSKFYTPGNPTSANDTPISQQLNTVGYYIYTVDGPRCTVDYYSAPASTIINGTTPTYTFTKQQTYGYSLNGKEFVVPQGWNYTIVQDSITSGTVSNESGFRGTSVQILSGKNGANLTTNYGKALSKAIDTGWTPQASGESTAGLPTGGHLASDVLTLWGMTQLGTGTASNNDTYTLSLSFDPAMAATDGTLRLMSRNGAGNWVDAVDLNSGGAKSFVAGAWKSSYSLGTYGIDATTDTAWAVVNNGGTFAVVGGRAGAVPEPASLAVIALGATALLARRRRARA